MWKKLKSWWRKWRCAHDFHDWETAFLHLNHETELYWYCGRGECRFIGGKVFKTKEEKWAENGN